MGLDQFAYARKGAPETETHELEYLDDQGIKQTATEVQVIYTDQIELAYWRKHPNLQGWMENLWNSKGGEGEFNCVDVELTDADLDWLEADIEGNELPETKGFFFGEDGDAYYKKGDLEFIKHAREHISLGYKIVYTSWW